MENSNAPRCQHHHHPRLHCTPAIQHVASLLSSLPDAVSLPECSTIVKANEMEHKKWDMKIRVVLSRNSAERKTLELERRKRFRRSLCFFFFFSEELKVPDRFVIIIFVPASQ
jgi:hypothetical protein